MTLTKKMAIGVLSLLMLIFIGTYLITMNNARNYFIEQLQSNSQDTATSLGLSLSQALANKDNATMLSMVQAVFDRGYFSVIEVKDIHGKELVSRRVRANTNTVPQWFTKLIFWSPNPQTSFVMNGWNQVGEVIVISNPDYAYEALWSNALGLVNGYLLFALASLLVVYLFISWLHKPLNRLKAQAQAIRAREFPIETNIPKTLEFREVTLAMNQMVLRIKELFQEQLKQIEVLHNEAYQDHLTGLGNRRFFLQQLTSLLSHEDDFAPGYLVIVAIDELYELNKHSGKQKADEVLLAVANTCVTFWKEHSLACASKLSGDNFALIVRENEPEQFIKNCTEFTELLQQLENSNTLIKINVGAAAYRLNETPAALLSETDEALKSARLRINEVNYKISKHISADSLNESIVLEALRENRLSLYAQKVTDGKVNLHEEIYARLIAGPSELGAGYFMPIAEKLGLAHVLDLYVLSEVSKKSLKENRAFAVNLSESTLSNDKNSKEYLQVLSSMPIAQRRLIHIEVSEALLNKHFSEIKNFLLELQRLEVTAGIDQAGLHLSPMQYLSDLSVDYIKMHGSLIQGVEGNQSKQFFLHYFNEMAKTLGIQVIACQVENENQWKAIQAIPMTWGQGIFLFSTEKLNP